MKLIISRLRDAKCTGQLLGATQKLYYLFDELGSVTAITDDSGMPIKYYLYDPYGNVTNTTNDPVNNLTFIGRYGGFKDWSTGFINFWHRWYDSEIGKWTTRDPIGVRGGDNLYAYTENNPVNGVDWRGLCPGPKSFPLPSIWTEEQLKKLAKCEDQFNECMGLGTAEALTTHLILEQVGKIAISISKKLAINPLVGVALTARDLVRETTRCIEKSAECRGYAIGKITIDEWE